MAFPMFATVAWLVWVLGQQSGIDGAGALLVLLVALSMLVWALTLRGRARTVVAAISLACARIAGLGRRAERHAGSPPQQTAGAAAGRWQAWEPGRVDQLLASGQPVFVDFTAAWCVTCQYNKKTTLAHEDVLADLDGQEGRLAACRLDPARPGHHGRARRSWAATACRSTCSTSRGSAPVVLSEVLGVEEVRSAIANL